MILSSLSPLRAAVASFVATVMLLRAQNGPALELKPGDHIAIIGNTLPDRMQHSGYLETLIHAKYPDHDLVVRNLAAAGDEVVTRHRSENFGTPDDWLKRTQADVILAFFGFNESFKGYEGLKAFKADLDKFLKDTRSKNYSGKGAPRVVLISPIAAERHKDPNFQDPAPINSNVQMYARAMEEIARANGVPYVDVYQPTQQLYSEAAAQGQSLTVNGIHLTEKGDQLLAPVLFKSLFGQPAPSGSLEKLRGAVNEKNWQWHQRYRTIDGYNVYGGRSQLSFPIQKDGPKVTNYKIMQEEMSQRDVLTANRDKRVWAVARGGDVAVDDSNLPPVQKIRSNKPGANPDETHRFLSGEAAIAKMKVHSGMQVNLFATEEQFPELVNPVQMAWDTRGRLWIAAWPNYPERTPDSPKGDSLLVFEDTDGDGRADKMTPFVDNLNGPTGFQFYKDGVIVVQAPDLWFLRDTDGDGRADWKERILMGLDSADSHHTANAVCLDPAGSIYLSDGVFHRTQIETALGPVRNNDAAIFKFEPRTGKFETYVAYGFANPHGKVFDYWGNDLITDATGNNTYFAPAFSGRLDYPAKHPGMKQFWDRPSRPCPGTGLLTSRHFPEEFQGNFLNCNVIGFQGIFRVKVSEDGSGLKGQTMEHLISSEDPNFRPSAVSVGPDGAIYFADWHNPIIGHMQHHIRDPNRDHGHGRIYRMTYKDRPLMKQPPIHGQSITALLDLLKEPENQIRELAKVELGARDTGEVIAATKRWAAALDKSDPAYEHQMMEALWVHQWHNVLDIDLLKRLLRSPQHQARAAATRVLCYTRDQVPDALALLRTQVLDEHPRVRLEAVRAASFFRNTDAVELALAALKHPTDYYIDYTLTETIRQLEPQWRRAIAEGHPIAGDNPAGIEYLIRKAATAELLKFPRTDAVQTALMTRADLPDTTRNEVLMALATSRNATGVAVALETIEKLAAKDSAAAGNVARLLPWQLAADLKPHRARLVTLAKSGGSAEIRQAGWASLVQADSSVQATWDEASQSAGSLADLMAGLPLLLDQDLRGSAYPKVQAILAEVPSSLRGPAGIKPETEAGNVSTLRRAAIRAAVSIPRDQDKTFEALTRLIAKGEEVTPAAQGIRSLPRANWPKDSAAGAADALVAWARNVPASGRTAQPYVEVVQLADELAGFMPADRAVALRRQLKEIRVAVFVVRTVREQMRYDTPRIVVEAGKPFEVVLENADFMPHNFVVVKPGARVRVGTMADTMKPDERDSKGRLYIPKSDEVLEASRMLESGQRATLKMTAPASEGIYEYMCTFPNHWPLMWGRLVVTKDVDAYLERHPVAPDLAAPVAEREGGK